jgi:hypothetical protein
MDPCLASGIMAEYYEPKTVGFMVEYTFTLDDGTIHRFAVDIGRSFDPAENSKEHPFWTKLDFNRCSNCPLSSKDFLYCPVALDVQEIAIRFKKILSSQNALVDVQTAERIYSKRCDVQTGLRSLLGLVMASSACPILSKLKGLAYYHLPFANQEETLFRTTSAYLLKQFLLFKEGKIPDLDLLGLDQLYQQLLTVNKCFKTRMDAVSEQDANMNALASLFYLSMGVAFSLEDGLKELKLHFSN